MAYKDTLAQVAYDLERESAFSYQLQWLHELLP
jgi:hypothetical protein